MLTKKNDQHGNDAQVFNLTQKVINRWTTLPLPTTDAWIQATEQDPDLRLLKRALKEKTVPLKAALTCKKCHDKLTGQRIIIKEGVLCQLEQPKATRIRQLQRTNSGWSGHHPVVRGKSAHLSFPLGCADQ